MAKYDTITAAAIDALAKPGWANYQRVLGPLEAAVEAKHPGAVARARDRKKKERFERKFIGPVPSWAKRYVAKYCPTIESLRIRQSRIKDYSSGHCWYGSGELVVTFAIASSDYGEAERQATVLHELAHGRATYDRHGDRFYDYWYEMLVAEGIYRHVLTCGRFVGTTSLKAAARRSRAACKVPVADTFSRSTVSGWGY